MLTSSKSSPSSPATSGSGEEGDTEIRSIITHLLNSDEDDTPHSYLIDQGARFDRLTDQWWDRCQRFYRLSSTQGKDPADCISINGLRRSISPHQAFAAYYMLSQEKRSGGGYLADEMGLGKVCPRSLKYKDAVWRTHCSVVDYYGDPGLFSVSLT